MKINAGYNDSTPYSAADVRNQAAEELAQEKWRVAVERQKRMLRWPWYKRLFPYAITIKIIDLREDA